MPSIVTVYCTLLSVFAVTALAAAPPPWSYIFPPPARQAAVQGMATPVPQDPMQSLAGTGDLTPEEQSQALAKLRVDETRYYRILQKTPAFASAIQFMATAFPQSAKDEFNSRPDIFLASIAKATTLPPYLREAPGSIQDTYKSVGSHDIQMYISEVRLVKSDAAPLPASVSSALASLSAMVSSSEVAARSSAAATTTSHTNSGPTASPIGSGRMTMTAAGVLVAAALIGIAML